MPDIMIHCPITGIAVPTGLTTEIVLFETLRWKRVRAQWESAGISRIEWSRLRRGGVLPSWARSSIVIKLTCPMWGVLVMAEPTQLPRRLDDAHLEALRTQIARCLEKELNLKAEERRERAQRLGIEWKIAEQPAEDQF